jgi:[ribosomal protein S18]-alanine N-acetyltransferase
MTALSSVRSLTVADAEQMSAVHADAFASHDAWSPKTFRDLLAAETARALGLFSDSELKALILVQYVCREAEILTLATRRADHRKGYARQVLDHLQARLQPTGLDRWLLDVAADNSAAIAFYRSHGFECDGRRADYYRRANGQHVDSILMSKQMAGQGLG